MQQGESFSMTRATLGGLRVSLGIIYGDIGTSPLYVMKAIVGDHLITEELVLGGVSCVFWTLTLMTTIKYVLLALRADNHGEGGTFSLYALVRRKIKAKPLAFLAMIGGCALLGDGMITPPISVSSAIEGLAIRNPEIPTIPIVLGIISALFFFQRFGTKVVGRSFGPIMFVWFSMLAVLGISQIMQDTSVLRALNPWYAINLLANYPGGIWLLGAVFLCTTGAEALYADLGHCGRKNIQVSWIFVKTSLLLNYFGQAAWILKGEGKLLEENPFYAVMPEWFLYIGIGIATIAAIIASQALISGSFTLISEAIKLNYWPQIKINYPTLQKGQLYIPGINLLLWVGCTIIVLVFKESEHMEAAYGLLIILNMLVTTSLLVYFFLTQRVAKVWVYLFAAVYFSIEALFLFSNLIKFTEGGYVSFIIAALLFSVMFTWYRASIIKRRLTEYVSLTPYLDGMKALSHDLTLSKFASNLVFLTSSENPYMIESKIIYSIFQKQPKRADIYWFIHVETTDEPYTLEYQVKFLDEESIIRITFRLGFRIEQRLSMYFRKVVEELVRNKEVDITSRYASLARQNISGDFRFVVLQRFLSHDNDLPLSEQIVMDSYFNLKKWSLAETRYFGLDASLVTEEMVPLVIKPAKNVQLVRLMDDSET